ncbi:hypothetical protein ABT033_31195 [Streptomyces pharetrae]|uniref:hypothetical protein n=1 Tax=Streptomyces pharetrae TaxID=291370 RepID=UPI003360ABDD
MAVADRAKRLRALARALNEHFELAPDTVLAEFDEYTRPGKWYLRWTDGPTVAQLTKAAKDIDADVLAEATLFRKYSNFVWALATIRLTMSTEELPPEQGYYPNSWHIREWLQGRKAPRPRNKREQVMAERLGAMYDDDSSAFHSPDTLMADFVRENGVAALLRDKGPREALLSPVEVLTDRYATGEALKAWTRRLVPLNPLEAFLAVFADQDPEPNVAAAALALVPEVHQAVDEAARGLDARVTAEAQAS